MKRAFTLVELVVVLAVVAALTHLAVRELAHLRDGRLGLAADRQMEAIRDGVYRCAPGAEATGFLADMGRLPRLVDGTLSELWSMPAGVLPYAVLEAVPPNLCAGVPAAPGVYVPTGWRGPYLRLAFGKSRLADPWGNPVEAKDDAGLTRLWTTNDGASVVAVSHYGPRAQANGERRMSIVPEPGATSRLVVSTTADSMTVAWYGPADGQITGAVANATMSTPAVFENLSPGRRILHYAGAAHSIDVKPGDNLISLEQP